MGKILSTWLLNIPYNDLIFVGSICIVNPCVDTVLSSVFRKGFLIVGKYPPLNKGLQSLKLGSCPNINGDDICHYLSLHCTELKILDLWRLDNF